MARGDIEATYTLNDRDFQRGLRRVEEQTATHSRRVDGLFADGQKSFGKFMTRAPNLARAAFLGVTGAVTLAGKALNDYAENNSFVRSQFTQLEAAGSRAWKGIGRDLSGLMTGSGSLVSLLDLASKGFGAVTTNLARGINLLGAPFGTDQTDPTVAEAELKRIEGMDKEIANAERLRAIRARGNSEQARALRVQLDFEKEIASLSDITASKEKDAAIAVLRAERDRQLTALSTPAGGARTLGAGMGSFSSAVFGASSVNEVSPANQLQRTNELLKQILSKINSPTFK